jgi:hypothetical protein
LDQMERPVFNHPGFAASRAGDNEDRPFRGCYRIILRGIEQCLEIMDSIIVFFCHTFPWNDFFSGSRTEGDIEIQKADKCKLKNVKCNYLVKEPKERISILHLFSAVITKFGKPPALPGDSQSLTFSGL